MAQEHKTSIAVAIGLLFALAFIVMLVFSGVLRIQNDKDYGFIDLDGNYGKAKNCYEWYGSIQCKDNGHTFNVKEYWMLVEGE